MRGYLLAVEDYPADDVERAVDQLVKGTAPGVNPSFRPKPSETGAECRRHMELRLRALELERLHRPRLPPPDIERTRESQARVRDLMASTIKALGDNTDLAERQRATEAKERADAEIKRRVETGELVELPGGAFPVSRTLAKSLGYELDRDERNIA